MDAQTEIDERGVELKLGRIRNGFTEMLQKCQKCPRFVYTLHKHNDKYLCGTCSSQEINKELEAKRRERSGR